MFKPNCARLLEQIEDTIIFMLREMNWLIIAKF